MRRRHGSQSIMSANGIDWEDLTRVGRYSQISEVSDISESRAYLIWASRKQGEEGCRRLRFWILKRRDCRQVEVTERRKLLSFCCATARSLNVFKA